MCLNILKIFPRHKYNTLQSEERVGDDLTFFPASPKKGDAKEKCSVILIFIVLIFRTY